MIVYLSDGSLQATADITTPTIYRGVYLSDGSLQATAVW